MKALSIIIKVFICRLSLSKVILLSICNILFAIFFASFLRFSCIAIKVSMPKPQAVIRRNTAHFQKVRWLASMIFHIS